MYQRIFAFLMLAVTISGVVFTYESAGAANRADFFRYLLFLSGFLQFYFSIKNVRSKRTARYIVILQNILAFFAVIVLLAALGYIHEFVESNVKSGLFYFLFVFSCAQLIYYSNKRSAPGTGRERA
ncbi:hypothetical protein SG34_027170 [Thalassomonas viridans]|uniref:Uncharacterized protein n=1 Tax=Thalassomonas viridans TaxID=137584 RepID=A0AAE9Z2N8_9GAMM|nr:hypothetical protein [Thalassomonas viridans]WDE04944.1 hypothetical protein SG34_027170 [Thalassomonas viridans]